MCALPSLLIRLICIVTALFTISCAATGARFPQLKMERKLYSWHDDGGDGTVSVRISLTDQIAEFKRGGRDIGWCYVATGKEGHGTADGSYKITEKIVDKYSNRYGWIEDEMGNVTDGDAKPSDRVPAGMKYVAAPMPFWMRLTSHGIGMHGGLIPEPGKPASHGCIRMPKEFVPTLFDSVNVGTPVVITHERSKVNQPREEIPESDLARKISSMPARTRGNPMELDNGSSESVRYVNGMPQAER